MSSPISRSDDLQRLRAAGYDLRIRAGYLVMSGVPYATHGKTVGYVELVSTLALTPDGRTARPDDHTMYFTNEDAPCDAEGRELAKLIADSPHQRVQDGFVLHHRFSHKPAGGYVDYFQKFVHYATVLTMYARRFNPSATAATFAAVETTEEDTPFLYTDTATSRAGIGAAARKLADLKIAIAGVGGGGSYTLDLIAKTMVKEIHLWDGDVYLWHTGFRAPGAPPVGVGEPPFKVDHYASVYGQMRRGIHPHPAYIDESNVSDLRGMDFVFISVDDGPSRQLISTKLEEFGVPFIDLGIGMYEVEGALGGVVRTTTSTRAMREHTRVKRRLPFGAPDPHNEYARNIQVADLNSLNAALAVIKMKKLFGFYSDLEHEHNSEYMVDGNTLINEDQPYLEPR